MKYSRILPTLALAVILSLLMIAIPATPALAQTVGVSPAQGPVGTAVTVTGTGFAANTMVIVTYDGTQVATSTIAADGTFSVTLTPSGVAGSHTITATDGINTATSTFTITTVTIAGIVISPSSSYVGDQVTVSGTGFTASSTVTIYFDASSVGSTATDVTGSFSNATFTVPESCRGSHTVKGSDATGRSSSVTFTTLSKITVIPASGAIGDIVTISGTGFAASSTITFYLDTVTASAVTTTTNTTGSFTNNTFTIPPTSRGSHTIKAQDASANSATASFTVEQKITISPTTGAPDTTVTVTGTGFGASMSITIKYNGVPVTTNPTAISTDAIGSFSASFSVPDCTAGTYQAEASDGTGSDSAEFTVKAAVSLSPTSGNAGTQITVSGTGFAANTTVTVSYDATQVATGSITATGAFSVTFTAPSSTGGSHTITATDTTNTVTSTFAMESTPPPIPSPLLPIMGGKEKSKAHFDWEDVTDPSTPVTYTLQIASDANFTTIVLEKTGLTASEYTLTKEEKLQPATAETLYYWRVRAIDGASNASGWTGAGTFHVGAVFELTGPILYTLIGIGGLLLLFVGIWIGLRMSRKSVQ